MGLLVLLSQALGVKFLYVNTFLKMLDILRVMNKDYNRKVLQAGFCGPCERPTGSACAHKGQKRDFDPRELKLQMLLTMGAGKCPRKQYGV